MKANRLLSLVRPGRPRAIWSNSSIYEDCLFSPKWIIEPKHDGYRCLLARGSDGYTAHSRHGKRLPVQPESMPDLPRGTVVDGEWMRATGDLVLFDIPVVGGSPNSAPLATRRAQLLEVVPQLGKARAITRLAGAPGVLKDAKSRGYEGLVLKDISRPYPAGETVFWLKVKG